MGSIPLVALNAQTPQQPDLLQKYGQLMQLKNMQTQQQMQQQEAPLRLQQLQQGVQSGGLQVQEQQQQLKDKQAITAAMQSWDGKDYNQLVPLVIKNGGSATAVMGLKKSILDQQVQAATAFKDNSQGAQAAATATKTKNDLITGALAPLVDPKQVPDAQLAPTLMSTVQSLTQQGALDPQHAQAATQIAQSGDPVAIRQGIDQFRKTLMGSTQILDEALKTAQTNSSNATAGKTQAEMDYYKNNGGAPGVPVEAQQQADWLKKNPGKGPSDYKLWTLQHTPSAMMMGNMLGGSQNSDALDLAAQNYLQTGQMPPGLYRSPGTIQSIIGRAAQMNAENRGAGIAFNKAAFQANKSSLSKLQTNYDQVQAFEQTASKNMDLLQQTAQKVPDLGSRWANVPVRMLNANMLGTANMAAFKTALATAQTEAAKVLNSSNATGVLSDSSRHELQDIIDGNVPYAALVASLNTLKQDMGNRTQSYQAQIQDIQGRIKGGSSSTPTNAPSGGTDPFAQFGGKVH